MTGYLWHGKPELEEINARIMAARTADGKIEIGQRGLRPGHGTDARATQHRREGEKPCPMCLAAERREHRRRQEARTEREARR